MADIAGWLKDAELRDRVLESRPIVFMNTCQGGQMTSAFYRGFAAEFLKRQATAGVGSQIDVPIVWAPEYAERFFTRLIAGDLVGDIVRDLAWEFLQKHKNPLGLTYSLYRGADARLLLPRGQAGAVAG